jgi:hypothetical protein
VDKDVEQEYPCAGGGSVTITGTIKWQETRSINVPSQTENDTQEGTFNVNLMSTVSPPDLGQQWHNFGSTYSVTDNTDETFVPNSPCPETLTGSVTDTGTLVDFGASGPPLHEMSADWQSPNGSPVGFNIEIDASEQQTETSCAGTTTSTEEISFDPFCGSALGPITGTFEGTDDVGTIPIDCTGRQMVGGEIITDTAKGLLEVNISGFTVNGSAQSTVGQAGKQDVGSPAEVQVCESKDGQAAYKEAEAEGNNLIVIWKELGLSTAAEFLAHFLDGTGTVINLPDTSSTASEIKNGTEFMTENENVMNYIKQQLQGGVTQIQLPTPDPLHAFAFTRFVFVSLTERDLYFAFRYTHGVVVSGSGSLVGNNYVGSLTYTISESYGFNGQNILLGFGPAMRYLQTVCGAPYYPGGAHWFPVTVTISEPINIPRIDSVAASRTIGSENDGLHAAPVA